MLGFLPETVATKAASAGRLMTRMGPATADPHPHTLLSTLHDSNRESRPQTHRTREQSLQGPKASCSRTMATSARGRGRDGRDRAPTSSPSSPARHGPPSHGPAPRPTARATHAHPQAHTHTAPTASEITSLPAAVKHPKPPVPSIRAPLTTDETVSTERIITGIRIRETIANRGPHATATAHAWVEVAQRKGRRPIEATARLGHVMLRRLARPYDRPPSWLGGPPAPPSILAGDLDWQTEMRVRDAIRAVQGGKRGDRGQRGKRGSRGKSPSMPTLPA